MTDADVPELTSDPTKDDIAACSEAVARLIAAGEQDKDLIASEYLRGATLFSSLGNVKDALAAWRAAHKLAPEKTLQVLSQLLKPTEADHIKRMITQQLPLLLKENKEKGRFFTARDILDVGRSVFFEHPYILTVDDAFLRKNCHHCCAPIKESNLFCQCGMAAYCSAQCEHAGKYYHEGLECNVLSKLGSAVTLLSNTRDLRMLVRLIVRRQLEEKHSSLLQRTSTFKDFMGLVSHLDALPEATKDAFRTMWGILSHLLPPGSTPPLEEIVAWGARIRANMHSISWMDEKEAGVHLNILGQIVNANPEVGAAIFPGISVFNHSCRPNCIFVTRGAAAAEVFAISKVAPGTELTVAYINTTLSFVERQKRLKEKYNFICNCVRCKEDKERLKDTLTTTTTTTNTNTPSISTSSCAACNASDAKLLLCGRCRSIAYCSAACQRQHWATHKSNCKSQP